MRIKSGLFIALILLLAVMVPAVRAGVPQQQTAAITSFTTTAQSITRTELSLNTARVPVTWEVTNRPANSNLVFEQVFTDGRVQNVELPRNFAVVDSSGVGVVAPVNPGTDEIIIQVRLVDLASNATYAQRQFTLPINDDPVQGSSIESFTSTRTSVSMAELNNGVLIPVSWQVQNYLPQSNLVFDQVLPNGQAVNVELPRNFLIVPPQGNGIVAPRLPGGDNDALVLRLRSVDLLPTPRVEGGIFSEAELTIDITNEPVSSTAQIDSFTTSVAGILRADLVGGGVRVPVSWSVSNRPANTNLFFVQVFPDGSSRNVELPRNFQIIPSSGDGVVAPVLPTGSNEVRIVLTLGVLNTGSLLDSAEITIPIVGDAPPPQPPDIAVAYGAVCLRQPFSPSNGIGQAQTGIVIAESDLTVFSAPLSDALIGTLQPGTSFTMVDSNPACYQAPIATNNQFEYRFWHVRSEDGTQGWVTEYFRDLNGIAYQIQPSNAQPSIDACLQPPYPADQGIRIGDRVTVTDNVGANGLSIAIVNTTGATIDPAEYDALEAGGTLNVVDGPVCRNEGDTTFGHIRLWRVRTDSGALEGWVYEHSNVLGNTRPFLTPVR
jgi:hypothetical protein